MIGLTALLIFGPCLMTAAVAGALFAAWRSLSRAHHILAWASGFAIMAIAIGLRGIWPQRDGIGGMLIALAVQVLGTAAIASLATGFAIRSGRSIRLEWPMLAFGMTVTTMHAWGAPRSVPAAFTAIVQVGCLAIAVVSLVRDRHRIILAEAIVTAALGLEMLLRLLAAVTLARGIVLPLAASGGHGWAPIFLIEPACLGLVAMFLIASDLSVELNRLVWTDPLTGVLNRAGFEDAATLAVKRARFPGSPVSLAIADIDHFKRVNDRHGHAVGDVTLREFARTLAGALSPDEVIGRIGGEEFALLLPAHDGDAALARIEPIRKLTERCAVGDEGGTRLTACFGIAQLEQGETLASLIERADRALYRCKQDGRNRCALAAMAIAG